MLSFNSNGITNTGGERTQFLQIKVDQDLGLVMNQDRLNDFLILSSEKDLSDSIDLEQILCRWAELPKTKRIINV